MILIGIAWAAVAVAPVTPTVAAVATRIHRAQHCIGSLLFVLLIFFCAPLDRFLIHTLFAASLVFADRFSSRLPTLSTQ